jgi:nitroimidazol reductase NimA-like FMN-containing flavoprotein (pyridoxamine 5'-phosphate oxidase superfamily)
MSGGDVVELDLDACFELLRSLEVGRVAVCEPGHAPHVVPVTYVIDRGTIVFRTGPGTKLDALRRGPASFQVDVIDQFHRTGWSVLVQGVAGEVEADDGIDLRPWSMAELAHWVRLVPVAVTGRRLTLPPSGPGPRFGYV